MWFENICVRVFAHCAHFGLYALTNANTFNRCERQVPADPEVSSFGPAQILCYLIILYDWHQWKLDNDTDWALAIIWMYHTTTDCWSFLVNLASEVGIENCQNSSRITNCQKVPPHSRANISAFLLIRLTNTVSVLQTDIWPQYSFVLVWFNAEKAS